MADLQRRRAIRALEAKRDVLANRQLKDRVALKAVRAEIKAMRGRRRASLRSVG